jgi:hypothetical protein
MRHVRCTSVCGWLLNADNLRASRFCRSFSISICPPILCFTCGFMAHRDAEWLDIPSFQQKKSEAAYAHLRIRRQQKTGSQNSHAQSNKPESQLMVLMLLTNAVVCYCTVPQSTGQYFPSHAGNTSEHHHITAPPLSNQSL